jgi:hypothetical protein
VLAEIRALGTNLVAVANGQTLGGTTAELPGAARGMTARLPGVTAVEATGRVSGVEVYKSPLIPRSKPAASAWRPPPRECLRCPAPASRRTGGTNQIQRLVMARHLLKD